jgi:hypothetical protein
MKLIQLLKEIKWQASTLEMCMNGMVPLSLPIIKQMVETKRTTAFHITDIDNLPKLASMEGKSKSISSFNKVSNVDYGPAAGSGMWTKGGVLVLLSGIVLAESVEDLWTKPDEGGRRWVAPGNAFYKAFSEENQIIDFAPQLKPLKEKWEKFTSSYNDIHGTEPDLTKEEKAYYIKTYIDTAYKLMLKNKESFQDKYVNSNYLSSRSNWNEIVLSKIKVEKIGVIQDNPATGYETAQVSDYPFAIQKKHRELELTKGRATANKWLDTQKNPRDKSKEVIDDLKKKYKNIEVIKTKDIPAFLKKYGVKVVN